MKIKMIDNNTGEEVSLTFRISTVCREYDGENKGGVMVRAWRCPSERKAEEDDLTLDLTLEPHEFDLISGKLRERAATLTVRPKVLPKKG